LFVHLPRFVAGVLPDAAWSFAIAATLSIVWTDGPAPTRSHLARGVWLGLGAALALGFEVGQGLGFIPGTFDLFDLLASAGFYLLAAWFLNPRSKEVFA
jgi:hypothetical protein